VAGQMEVIFTTSHLMFKPDHHSSKMKKCLGTTMSESTKLYSTVKVQKLEAELQLVSETLSHVNL